jgi:hypothetical protein
MLGIERVELVEMEVWGGLWLLGRAVSVKGVFGVIIREFGGCLGLVIGIFLCFLLDLLIYST